MTSHTEVARLEGVIASGSVSVASSHDGAVFYSDDAGKNRVATEAYADCCQQAGKLESSPDTNSAKKIRSATQDAAAKRTLANGKNGSADTHRGLSECSAFARRRRR